MPHAGAVQGQCCAPGAAAHHPNLGALRAEGYLVVVALMAGCHTWNLLEASWELTSAESEGRVWLWEQGKGPLSASPNIVKKFTCSYPGCLAGLGPQPRTSAAAGPQMFWVSLTSQCRAKFWESLAWVRWLVEEGAVPC